MRRTSFWRSGRKILHSVVGDRWGGRVRMTPQLRRDLLQWWTSVPSQSNGKPIHRPVKTAYLHTDNSGYGWGGVLNGRLEARGFRSSADERHHITWNEPKAVRLAVESFLPRHLAGRNILMHEDNEAVCHVLSGLTSRFPEMMAELRRLCNDWQLDPLLFSELESRFGPYSIDRFASALNTLLPRYNAAWMDPTCEAVDSLHLPDADWRRENNWCNAPWPLIPDIVHTLQQNGAAATVVAPRWEGKAWHQALPEVAVEELMVAPRAGLFRPGRRDGREQYAYATRRDILAFTISPRPPLVGPPYTVRSLKARHNVSRTLKPAATVVFAIIQAELGRSLSVIVADAAMLPDPSRSSTENCLPRI
eukprot:jgi/Tetstr1/433793/TSEL_002419.t1